MIGRRRAGAPDAGAGGVRGGDMLAEAVVGLLCDA